MAGEAGERTAGALHAGWALLPSGWARDVRVTLAGDRIAAVTTGAPARAGDVACDGLVPGVPNVHSHAFQRGFSGLTERRAAAQESFWTWRETMYRFALALSPDDMQAIAEMAYVEMLEAGFTRVGEFHYLHHAPDGTPYADPAEMSARIFAAAAATGIALTHLPVFYAHGGFGPVPAGAGQRRFLHDLDAFVALVSACDRLATRPQDRVGYAPHSLRAAARDDLVRLAAALPLRPVHIHVAEQTREVAECLAVHGARPVAWLLDAVPVDARWCLIHATHADPAELAAVARSDAVAGLCPVTEANLGDGVFPARAFLGLGAAGEGEAGDESPGGAAIAVGTDSNIRIDLADELRLLEYAQRLVHRERTILAPPAGSNGLRLLRATTRGGARALGAAPPAIAPGAAADLVALRDPLGAPGGPDGIVDRWLFGRDVTVSAVWAAGVARVQGGRHTARDAVVARFRAAVARALG